MVRYWQYYNVICPVIPCIDLSIIDIEDIDILYMMEGEHQVTSWVVFVRVWFRTDLVRDHTFPKPLPAAIAAFIFKKTPWALSLIEPLCVRDTMVTRPAGADCSHHNKHQCTNAHTHTAAARVPHQSWAIDVLHPPRGPKGFSRQIWAVIKVDKSNFIIKHSIRAAGSAKDSTHEREFYYPNWAVPSAGP